MARLAAERLGDTRLAIEIYNTILGEERRSSPRRSRRSRGSTIARSGTSRTPRSCIARSRSAHRRQGGDRAAREARPGLLRAARRAAAGGRGVEGDPRHRAEPREGAAHAARAVRDGRRLRGPRAALREARPGRRARRGTARDRRPARREGSPVAARQRAAELAQKRADAVAQGAAGAREGAPGVGARARGRAAPHGCRGGTRADLHEAGEVGAPALGARDRAVGGEGAGRPAREDRDRSASCARRSSRSKTLAFDWAVRAFELDPSSA